MTWSPMPRALKGSLNNVANHAKKTKTDRMFDAWLLLM